MSKNIKSGKIQLDADAILSAKKMMDELKEESSFFNPSPSAFISEVVRLYRQKQFKKNKDALISRLFDKRSYTKELILKGELPEELLQRIEKLHEVGVRRARKSGSSRRAEGLNSATEESE